MASYIISFIISLFLFRFSPIGIASLIAAKILEITDLVKTAKMLGIYMFTVVLGLSIQLFVTLPIVLYLASHKNPFKFMNGLTQAAMMALGTASRFII